jgi:hypothetical protein
MARLQSILACLTVLLLAPAPAAADPKAVVELFTSQGCSSCVPADAYFAELAKREDVLALSFHVDYWDYLGWRDTLGQPENAARQRAYGEVRGSRKIFTPQITVSGRTDLVGSDRNAVEAAIDRSRLPLPVLMRRGAGTVEIEVAAHPLPHRYPATIRLVLFTARAEVEIARGENAGATIAYHNVVRAMRPIGMWDGGTVRITLPEHELMGDGVDGCAVIVQEDLPTGPGAILGAANLGRW